MNRNTKLLLGIGMLGFYAFQAADLKRNFNFVYDRLLSIGWEGQSLVIKPGFKVVNASRQKATIKRLTVYTGSGKGRDFKTLSATIPYEITLPSGASGIFTPDIDLPIPALANLLNGKNPTMRISYTALGIASQQDIEMPSSLISELTKNS